jgi:hypothetical protein
MPLIKCPDCAKGFSDQAKACPNCGRPSTNWRLASSNQLNNASFALFGVAVVFYFLVSVELAAVCVVVAFLLSVAYYMRKAGII